MGRKVIDLTGKKFGRLTVIKKVGSDKSGKITWLCKCDCGKEIICVGSNLNRGDTKSCGCLAKENVIKFAKKSCYKNTRPCKLNDKLRSDNTSGYKGVYKAIDKWQAKIGFQGNEYYLGTFDNIEDAIKARKEAEEKYFKPILEEFKNEQ